MNGKFDDVHRFFLYLSSQFNCIAEQNLKIQSNVNGLYNRITKNKSYIVDNKDLDLFNSNVEIFNKVFSTSNIDFKVVSSRSKFIIFTSIHNNTFLFKILSNIGFSKFEKNNINIEITSIVDFVKLFFSDLDSKKT